MNLDEPVDIYENHSNSANSVLVRLEGKASNRYGIGAVVTVTSDSGSQTKLLKANSGFLASDEPLLHFGLGSDQRIHALEIRWPSGQLQIAKDLHAGSLYTVREADIGEPTEQESELSEPNDKPMFARSDVLRGLRHVERNFDDYRLQPLLPNKLSQLGPGIAWADVDGDGDDDGYFGGAAGSRGRLIRNDGNDVFTETAANQRTFRVDSGCEDMGALFFDLDSDGDLDLYVVSGGVEARLQRDFQDRVYLNDGSGNFAPAPQGVLPSIRTSGSVVVGADYDRDGDVDLFVGGRVVPGKYPLSPRSYLLRNDDGRLVDVTKEVAPALFESGLVTGAVWSDANNDRWIDLLVTHEWGSRQTIPERTGKIGRPNFPCRFRRAHRLVERHRTG